MKIKGEDLRIGDTIRTIWAGHNSAIKCFQEYKGPFDFICKTAEFLDGAKMSIDKERYYDCEERS